MTTLVWPFRPNWRDSVVDSLQWRTELGGSRDGTESRRAKRSAPRRRYRFLAQSVEAQVQALDGRIVRGHAGDWYVPIWHDVTRTVFSLSAGATSITVEGIDEREFTADGYAVIISPDGTTFEQVAIAGLITGTNDGITASSGIANDYPAGSTVYPAHKGRLPEAIDIGQITAAVTETSVEFDLIEQPPSPSSHTLSTYNDGTGARPIWAEEPNWLSPVGRTYERLFSRTDAGVGAWRRDDLGGIEFFRQTRDHQFTTRSEMYALRQWLGYLSGRYREFWAPTWTADLTRTRGLTGTDNYLYVEPIDWSQYGSQIGRRDIFIKTSSGYIAAGINGAASESATEDRLTLDTTPTATAKKDIKKICWLQPVRLGSDQIEYSNVTPEIGSVTTEVRSLNA